MQERHLNRRQYFQEQIYTTEKHVIPFIEKSMNVNEKTTVLEIGCGEGGNLKPFLDRKCKRICGIDLSERKIGIARDFYSEIENGKRVEFICEDIYETETLGEFDLIICRDVIEHIHNQEKFMDFVKKFLKPAGKFFLAFPPWYNPFGGHQQICKSILSKTPYFHILPTGIYTFILRAFKESPAHIADLLEVKDTGITVERFERILKLRDYSVDQRTFWFINPNYEVKFKLKPKKQARIISAIPGLRNFVTTASYYLISK